VEGIVADTISWEEDPDFGYEVASAVPGLDDLELLQPRRLYERQGRSSEYRNRVSALHAEREHHLSGYQQLYPEIAKAV